MVLCITLMNIFNKHLVWLYISHYNLKIKITRDILVGNVLVISILSFIIEDTIFVPKCLNLIKSWKVIIY